MDVEAAIALASTAAAGAAGEAGRAAWQSLVGLARRVTGRAAPSLSTADAAALDTASDAAPVPVDTGPAATGPAGSGPAAADAAALLAVVSDRARTDAGFAAALCAWAEAHRPALEAHRDVDQDTVTNVVAGSATVHGHVVQARDVHGGVNFGG